MRSTLAGPLVDSEVGHYDHLGPVLAEQIDRDDQFGSPGAEHRGNADTGIARGLGERRQRRQPGAAADGDDVAPAGVKRKADTERPHDVEAVADLQGVEAAGAGTGDFVEKLHLALARARRRKCSSAAAGTGVRLWAADTAVGRTVRAYPRPRYRCNGPRGDDTPH